MLFTNFAKAPRFCSLMDWFLTSWAFKITSLLNLNKNQCNTQIFWMNWIFSWLWNVFLKSFRDWLNSVEQRQGNGTKMLTRKCLYHGKHMKDWKKVLIQTFKQFKQVLILPNFFFGIRLSIYWQNAFVNILSKTSLVGKYL